MITLDQTEDLLKKQYEQLCSSKEIEIIDVWNLFKDYCGINVLCNDEALLFQCGVFNFTGEDLFYVDFVRQFIVEEDGEYSYMEQLHCELTFKPSGSLQNLEKNLWSYDTENNYIKFFEQVEGLEEFELITNHLKIESLEIKQEMI